MIPGEDEYTRSGESPAEARAIRAGKMRREGARVIVEEDRDDAGADEKDRCQRARKQREEIAGLARDQYTLAQSCTCGNLRQMTASSSGSRKLRRSEQDKAEFGEPETRLHTTTCSISRQ